MSQLLDVAAGAAYEEVAPYAAPMLSAAGSGGGGGWLGALQTLGTGYLSRRIDIDLQGRLQQQGTAQLRGDQRPINQTVSGNMLAGVSNTTMLALGAAALVVVVLVAVKS